MKSSPNHTRSRTGFVRFSFIGIFYRAIPGLLLILMMGCKHEPDIIDPDQPGGAGGTPSTPTTIGAVTPVATPEGSVVTVTIGPAGGAIESADERLRVEVPAGALSTTQTITLQPLSSNNCPLGTGRAFRLLPHGLTFAKPATLTIQYDQRDLNGSAPQALRIAYQTDKGHWESPPTKSLDTTAKFITVQTTHFSDWGLFQNMRLEPGQAFLNPGDHQKLQVSMIPFTTEEDEKNLIVPLSKLMPTQYIESWTLQGAGTLAHQHNVGDYYAPAKIPATNPVTVTVFLNRSATIDGQIFKDLRLVANFYVAPEGISIRVGNDEWQTFPGGANLNGEHNVVAGAVGSEHVQVIWQGAPTGKYAWTAGPGVSFLYVNGKFHRSHMYFKIVSGGQLVVDNEHPDWCLGTFTLTSAGWLDTAPIPPAHGTTAITGVFRVKRI